MSKVNNSHYRRYAEIKREQYYTPDKLARRLTDVALEDGEPYDLTLEPSAGKGAFSNAAPGWVVALDLEPKAPGVTQGDFLKSTVDDFPKVERLLVLGNPPFGRGGVMALEFIKHSIKLGATTIAFILPQSFGKYSKQVDFPEDWRLIKLVELSKDESVFEIEGKTRPVCCDFFVWTRDPEALPGVNLRDKIYSVPKEFTVLRSEDIDEADISVNNHAHGVRLPSETTNLRREILLKINEGYDKGEVIRKLRSIKLRPLGGGGPPYLSRNSFFGYWHNSK